MTEDRAFVRLTLGPAGAAFLALLFHIGLVAPIWLAHDRDVSVFIFAGDTWTDASRLVSPIAVAHRSQGYDGQAFYRLALDPATTAATDYGVTLDAAAKRAGRIAYPLLAWLVSLGQPSMVPAALLAVNLGCFVLLGSLAAWMRQRLGLAWWFPVAVLAWPGFSVAVLHDTAEIVAATALLAALATYLTDRIWLFAVAGAVALLTRETTLPVLAGIFLVEAARSVGPDRQKLVRTVIVGAVFAPFLAWWAALALIWRQAPQSVATSPDLGWPMLGLFQTLWAALAGDMPADAARFGSPLMRGFVWFALSLVLGFCLVVARRAMAPPRRLTGIAAGWWLSAGLMTLLTAKGPLTEMMSFFRAFSECWVAGCLLLSYAPSRPATPRPWVLAWGMAAFLANFIVWKWTLDLLGR